MNASGRMWVAAIVFALALPTAAAGTERIVVLMLFDGLAPALVESVDTPHLDRMAREGASTDGFLPAFPTVSLINGVTISTGCWPEQHGIVGNRFLDPERGLYDHGRDADWLTGCEHLHQVAERQEVRSAVLNWYGSFSTKHGDLASHTVYHLTWQEQPQDAERAAEVVELLELPEPKRPRLILAYFRGPDGAAHFTGMDSEETLAAVRGTDAAVGTVLDAVDRHPQREEISVVVTTDHGMVPVSHVVNVTRILRRHDIPARAVSDGSSSFLYFDDPEAIATAQQALAGYDEFEVYRKTALPEWARIGAGPRVGDLVISTKPPYFTADIEDWPPLLQWLGTIGPDFLPAFGNLHATHGYPPDTPGVAGVLYAHGSGIAEGRRLETMRAIDVHPTVTHLLGIEPGQPSDGAPVQQLLR